MSIRPYLGSNVSPTSIEEIFYRQLLEEHELLLAVFDGVLLDEHNRRVGGLALSDFVILTDRRLLTWARGLWADSVDGLPWKDVDVVESSIWDPIHGRVRLAMRLPGAVKRSRRISVKGNAELEASGNERIIINTLDYMPANDVFILADMVAWVGDQVLAGVYGDPLQHSFAETFPELSPDATNQGPFPTMMSRPSPEPEPEPTPEPKRRSWWPFGKKKDAPPKSVGSSEGLVSAYERQHGGGSNPNPSRAHSTSPLRPPASSSAGGPLYTITTRGVNAMQQGTDPLGIYSLSRTLRLAIEMPQRLRATIQRANEVVGGTTELLEGMQDAKVRRTAIAGLNLALSQEEQKQGPFAAVAPMVRAAINMASQNDDSSMDDDSQNANSRRIQVVRTPARQRPDGGRVRENERPPQQIIQKPKERIVERASSSSIAIVPRMAPIESNNLTLEPKSPRGDKAEIRASKPVVTTSARIRRQVAIPSDEADVATNGARPRNGNRSHNDFQTTEPDTPKEVTISPVYPDVTGATSSTSANHVDMTSLPTNEYRTTGENQGESNQEEVSSNGELSTPRVSTQGRIRLRRETPGAAEGEPPAPKNGSSSTNDESQQVSESASQGRARRVAIGRSKDTLS